MVPNEHHDMHLRRCLWKKTKMSGFPNYLKKFEKYARIQWYICMELYCNAPIILLFYSVQKLSWTNIQYLINRYPWVFKNINGNISIFPLVSRVIQLIDHHTLQFNFFKATLLFVDIFTYAYLFMARNEFFTFPNFYDIFMV